MTRRSQGFTVIELLIASAILMVVLGGLGGIYVSSMRAYEVNRQVTTSSGQLRAAIEALTYDVSLAGYCVDPSACSLGGTPLEVDTLDAGGLREVLSITSRYEETRYTGGSATLAVTFSVVDGKLVRSSGGGQVTLADGIQRLLLLGYRSRDDETASRQFTRPPGSLLSGIDVRVEYLQGGKVLTEDITIPLRNSL